MKKLLKSLKSCLTIRQMKEVSRHALLCVMVCSLFFYSCAGKPFSRLDKADKAMFGTAIGLIAADYYQTLEIIDDPSRMESNELIGDDKDKALIVIGGGGLVLLATAYLLPDKWRKVFLGFCIGGRYNVVVHNERLRGEL